MSTCAICDEDITGIPKFIAKPDGGYKEHPSLPPQLQLRISTAHPICAEQNGYAPKASQAILELSDEKLGELTAKLNS